MEAIASGSGVSVEGSRPGTTSKAASPARLSGCGTGQLATGLVRREIWPRLCSGFRDGGRDAGSAACGRPVALPPCPAAVRGPPWMAGGQDPRRPPALPAASRQNRAKATPSPRLISPVPAAASAAVSWGDLGTTRTTSLSCRRRKAKSPGPARSRHRCGRRGHRRRACRCRGCRGCGRPRGAVQNVGLGGIGDVGHGALRMSRAPATAARPRHAQGWSDPARPTRVAASGCRILRKI